MGLWTLKPVSRAFHVDGRLYRGSCASQGTDTKIDCCPNSCHCRVRIVNFRKRMQSSEPRTKRRKSLCEAYDKAFRGRFGWIFWVYDTLISKERFHPGKVACHMLHPQDPVGMWRCAHIPEEHSPNQEILKRSAQLLRKPINSIKRMGILYGQTPWHWRYPNFMNTRLSRI